MKRLFYLLMLGTALAAIAQTEHIVVAKRAKGNPTVGVVEFIGEKEDKRAFENLLWRCGWLDVVTGADVKGADVQVTMQDGTVDTVITPSRFIVMQEVTF